MPFSPDLLTVNDTPGAHAPSYYAATATRQTDLPRLEGDLKCDVCVVGGGFTGLSSALHLAERGFDVVLLEASKIGWGASGRNGGQLGTGQRVDQSVLERRYGSGQARHLWDLALESVDLTRRLIDAHKIDCDFRPGILHVDHRPDYVSETQAYVDKLQSSYDYDKVRFVAKDEVREMVASPLYHGGSLDTGGGHVHPLNLALGLGAAAEARGARIFEKTRVLSFEAGQKVTIRTETATVQSDFLILGCNGYLGTLDKHTACHVMPINNFIVATEPLADAEASALIRDRVAVADSKFVINYFRLSESNRLLFGGGETYGYRFPEDIGSFVRKPMEQVFPQLKSIGIDYGWGGTLAITMKRMPFFSRVHANVLSASGYSGHGVGMAILAGKVLAEAVDGNASRFDVFERIKLPAFPGGDRFRYPLLVLAMTWFSLRDKLGL